MLRWACAFRARTESRPGRRSDCLGWTRVGVQRRERAIWRHAPGRRDPRSRGRRRGPASLRQLLLPGQRRFHTAKESPRRRRTLIDAVSRVDGLSATVLRYRRPAGTIRVAGRHLLLQAATGLIVGSGVSSWVLDDQDEAQLSRDRAAIAHALAGVDRQLHPVYDHRPANSEPLLGQPTRSVGPLAPAGTGLAAWRTWSPFVIFGPDAQHPATHRPESTPGALPAATAASPLIVPRPPPRGTCDC